MILITNYLHDFDNPLFTQFLLVYSIVLLLKDHIQDKNPQVRPIFRTVKVVSWGKQFDVWNLVSTLYTECASIHI